MRRSNSYSLQKINPNISSNNHYQSRIQLSPKSRLNFPAPDDSGFYGGVGRKHYQRSTQFIHKLILKQIYKQSSPSYNKSQEPIPRSKSEGYLKLSQQKSQNQQNKKELKPSLNSKLDSLSILEQQFSKKLTTQASPQKYIKHNQLITPSTDIPYKKSILLNSKNNSQFNLFASVDKLYEQIINPVKRNQQNQINKRKLNPTYLSSDLGYV